MARYPNIGDHGLIGDLQTAALVSTDGVLDWFCCPRFDSPSIFASLLDADRGGFYRIAPDRDGSGTSRRPSATCRSSAPRSTSTASSMSTPSALTREE
jgi:GH15 family glucan-1,4-alpha-glucosidase